MVGIISADKRFKTIHIVFTIVDFIMLAFLAYKLFTINYASIYQQDKSSSIEYLPLYFGLTIVLLVIFIISISILLFCKKYNSKIIFAYLFFIVFIVIAVIIGVKLPNVSEYSSSGYDREHSEYLPIDKFEYNKNSSDYYYYRDVTIGDIHWIGSCSYKDFAAEDAIVDLTEETYESTVFMNYYYLLHCRGLLCFLSVSIYKKHTLRLLLLCFPMLDFSLKNIHKMQHSLL